MDMPVSLWCTEVEETELLCTPGTTAPSGGHGGSVKAAFDPTMSGHRVIQSLLHLEERYLPSMLYISLIQRDPERREELAKWSLEVCSESGCDEAVFPLSVSLLDRFLSASLSLPVSPYCLAAACILIASKLSECDNLTADTLCAAAEYSFQPSNLREMERVVLATLRWDTAAVTPQDFLPHILSHMVEHDEELAATLRRHSDTLAAMCVCDSRFLGAMPSLVAAASLNCALRGLCNKDPHQLTGVLAELCHTDPVVLEAYSDMIEHVLQQRLRTAQPGALQKGDEVEDERAGTPTDMREIDL
ncbi:cyclin Dx isoform X3 [Synchiropus splendidus]|uniref:cyclin Dx isoform X3 n=1 Tax=Synchiropus splendidus TaxID=270530 RepID=UPI00237DCAB8|nr:cyclin Dx isoform X3 [Synchiropus splendidus]